MPELTSNEKKKFTLIELLMIFMVVGIIITFIIPMRQTKLNQGRVREAVHNLQIIAQANVQFFNSPDNGYFAVDLSQLNVTDKLEKIDNTGNYYFDYSLTDSTVVAKTNSNFGKSGAEIFYYLPKGPMQVAEDKLSRDTIDPNWLP